MQSASCLSLIEDATPACARTRQARVGCVAPAGAVTWPALAGGLGHRDLPLAPAHQTRDNVAHGDSRLARPRAPRTLGRRTIQRLALHLAHCFALPLGHRLLLCQRAHETDCAPPRRSDQHRVAPAVGLLLWLRGDVDHVVLIVVHEREGHVTAGSTGDERRADGQQQSSCAALRVELSGRVPELHEVVELPESHAGTERTEHR